MQVDIIAGTRPNFMKIAPIVRAVNTRALEGGPLTYRLIHTGQHYDQRMSGSFFVQLEIPDPDINLGVGSGTQAEQTGAIMIRYEKVLSDRRPDLCLVVGDVTSTMACAIAAQKLHIPVAHVEAGIRSNDWSMPEEINRLVTDAITNWFFTTSEHANANLRQSGVADERIFYVGNTMIDTLLHNIDRLIPPAFVREIGLEAGRYLVLTLHRPSNVDEVTGLLATLNAIGEGAAGMPVIFPVHPRTAKSLEGVTVPKNLRMIDPQPYLEFNWLVKHAMGVITDSGGVTEETTVMGIPCLTLRDSTERPETVEIGTNELLGTDPAVIPPALGKLLSGEWKKGEIPELWDGNTAQRIVAELERLLGQ